MKPENSAIRQLEKSLEGASPEMADAIGKVIFGLDAVVKEKNPEARKLAQAMLAKDVAALEKLRGS